MSLDPAADITNYLDTNSTQLTLATNLFIGAVKPVVVAASTSKTSIPVAAVFVRAEAGQAPLRVLGTAMEVRQPGLQILTRAQSYSSGRALAMHVHDTLQSVSPSSYMDVMARQSEPAYLGEDKAEAGGAHLFSDNFLIRYQTT